MMKQISNTTTLLVALTMAILVTACAGKPYMVKPSDEYMGNISIQSVEVVKTDEVESDTIVAAVKSQLQKDVADLAGAKAVDMKVTLNYLTAPVLGGEVTKALIGSETRLGGVVEMFDSGKLIGKFNIISKYSEGGLLSKMTTLSFVDTQAAVVRKFSEYVMVYLN